MRDHLLIIDIQKCFTGSKIVYENVIDDKFINPDNFDSITYIYDISNTIHYTFWGNKFNYWDKRDNISKDYDFQVSKEYGFLQPAMDILPEYILYAIIEYMHNTNILSFKGMNSVQFNIIIQDISFINDIDVNYLYSNLKVIRNIKLDKHLYNHIINNYKTNDNIVLIGGSTKFCLNEIYHLLIGLNYQKIKIVNKYTYI